MDSLLKESWIVFLKSDLQINPEEECFIVHIIYGLDKEFYQNSLKVSSWK